MGFNIDITFDTNEVYRDALQPAVKEIGKGLEDIAKTANLILAPFTLCGAYSTRFRKWCKRLENEIDEKNMQEAQPNILIPTLAGLAINPDETLLGEMFFNILKSSIDKTKQKFLSPAFPKILEQLSKDEAVILTLIKKYGEIRFEYLYWADKDTQEYREELEKVHSNESKIDRSLFLMHRNHLATFGIFKFSSFQESESLFKMVNQLINYKSLEGQKIITSGKSSEYQTICRLFQSITFNDFGKHFAEACISPKCEEYI